jgi:hypothetical protein
MNCKTLSAGRESLLEHRFLLIYYNKEMCGVVIVEIFPQYHLAGQYNQAFKIQHILMLVGGKKNGTSHIRTPRV